MLPISEIFFSIQGEGLNLGKPSVFIRLYYCNLYCIWCDTKYTWKNQFKAKEGIDFVSLSVKEIVEIVSKYGCKNVVITGGEPLVHQSKLSELIRVLKERDYYVEIETNGTIAPDEELLNLIDLFTVSPKLSNSKVKLEQRIRPEALKVFSKLDNCVFKFVIQEEEDLEEVLCIVKDFNIDKNKVFLMPEGVDKETLEKRSSWLVEECKKYGFRFTPRLHIMIWGNKRGF